MSSQFTLTPEDKRGLLILVAIIGLLAGLVFLPVSILEVYKLATAKEPTIPEGFWSEVLDVKNKLLANKDTVSPEVNEVLVPFANRLQLAIEFEEHRSIRAMWSGYEANAMVDPPADIVVALDPASHDDWDKYLSGFARSFTPSLTTTLQIGEDLLHKPLMLNLSMVISYPVESSKKGYFSNGGEGSRGSSDLFRFPRWRLQSSVSTMCGRRVRIQTTPGRPTSSSSHSVTSRSSRARSCTPPTRNTSGSQPRSPNRKRKH